MGCPVASGGRKGCTGRTGGAVFLNNFLWCFGRGWRGFGFTAVFELVVGRTNLFGLMIGFRAFRPATVSVERRLMTLRRMTLRSRVRVRN